MNNQPDYFYVDKNNEIIQGHAKVLYYCVVNKYPIVLYETLYHCSVWGYTDELKYKKLSIHIPYDHQEIYDFLNLQIQRYIQAKLLSIL